MKKQDLQVFQANNFVESRQSYSLNEKRLLSTLISFVKPTDEEFMEYELSIKDWAKLLNVSPKGLYQVADEITDGLMTKIVSIKDPNTLYFEKWHVLSRAKYRDGILTLKINKEMNDLFIKLRATKNFTHYELAEFVTLTSTHAQRIYELMKQYQHSKQRERTIEIPDLREMLGLKEEEYKLYANFRRRVLELAYNQIQEHTSLRYKWEGIKRGRRVTKIRFYEIHTAGKENPNEIQEKAFIQSYIGQEIYNEEFNLFFRIKEIHKEGDFFHVVSDFDGAFYPYESIDQIQKSIGKAVSQQLLDNKGNKEIWK